MLARMVAFEAVVSHIVLTVEGRRRPIEHGARQQEDADKWVPLHLYLTRWGVDLNDQVHAVPHRTEARGRASRQRGCASRPESRARGAFQ
jgi:hypothetical protein